MAFTNNSNLGYKCQVQLVAGEAIKDYIWLGAKSDSPYQGYGIATSTANISDDLSGIIIINRHLPATATNTRTLSQEEARAARTALSTSSEKLGYSGR